MNTPDISQPEGEDPDAPADQHPDIGRPGLDRPDISKPEGDEPEASG